MRTYKSLKHKKCSKCNKIYLLHNFIKRKDSKDGLIGRCKNCRKKERKLNRNKKLLWDVRYRHSFKGWLALIYGHQRAASKQRNMTLPTYTKEKLKKFVLNQSNVNDLFNNWKNSKYNFKLTPSIDRIDDNKSYTLNNIRLITWKENWEKCFITNQKKIRQLTLSGKFIRTWNSLKEAKSYLGLKKGHGHISNCLTGKRNQTYGFKWEYAN